MGTSKPMTLKNLVGSPVGATPMSRLPCTSRDRSAAAEMELDPSRRVTSATRTPPPSTSKTDPVARRTNETRMRRVMGQRIASRGRSWS